MQFNQSFFGAFFVGCCSWNMKRETQTNRERQRDREKEKNSKAPRKKGKKKTNKPKTKPKPQTAKKNPYKIEMHYVFVYFRNVAKLNH